MGIRFACANCNKLMNIKAELGGKTGTCPQCKSKIKVPMESALTVEQFKQLSEEQSSSGEKSAVVAAPQASSDPSPEIQPGQGQASNRQPVATSQPVQKPVQKKSGANMELPLSSQPSTANDTVEADTSENANSSTEEEVVEVEVVEVIEDQDQAAGSSANSVPMAIPLNKDKGGATNKTAAAEVAATNQAATNQLPDPIEANPSAMWYVRPTSGGQFGPATGELMKKWMAEGRVSPDAYVWQDGWPDWKLANQVFQEYASSSSVSAINHSASSGTGSTDGIPDSLAIRTRIQRKKRRQTTFWITMMIVGTLVLIGLIVLMVIILQRV